MKMECEYTDFDGSFLARCEIQSTQEIDGWKFRVGFDGGDAVQYAGHDLEDCLLQARCDLESRGMILLIDRFKREAYVSSMSRQMTSGLCCYLVRPRTPLAKEFLVDSLGSCKVGEAVPEVENEKYIRSWMKKPPRKFLGLFRLGDSS